MRRLISMGLVMIALLAVPALARAAADFVPVPDIDKYLTPGNMDKLRAGEVVKENVITRDAQGKDSGHGVALVLVNAPKDKVITMITDFASYASWMPTVESAKVLLNQDDRIDVEFEISILGIGVHYTVIHKVDRENGAIRFRLDDSKPKKNIQDTVGAWVVKPLNGYQCIVAYTVAVDTGLSVPKFVQDWFSNKSLVKVQKAVKKRIEGK